MSVDRRQAQVDLGPAGSVWFWVQERFHKTSPGDLKRIFTKAGGSESLGVRK